MALGFEEVDKTNEVVEVYKIGRGYSANWNLGKLTAVLVPKKIIYITIGGKESIIFAKD